MYNSVTVLWAESVSTIYNSVTSCVQSLITIVASGTILRAEFVSTMFDSVTILWADYQYDVSLCHN